MPDRRTAGTPMGTGAHFPAARHLPTLSVTSRHDAGTLRSGLGWFGFIRTRR